MENERSTILLEADDVFKNKYEVVFDLLHEAAYKGCSLAFPILGYEENIKKFIFSCFLTLRFITRDDLKNYVLTHYTGPRVVVVGSGAVDHDNVHHGIINHL